MLSVIHVVETGHPRCTGIYQIITGLAENAARNDCALSVLFLEDGPLRVRMAECGIQTHSIRWNGSLRDLRGALGVWKWLKKNPAKIIHLHWGGRAVRTISRLGGAQIVIQHVHGRVDEMSGLVSKRMDYPGVDGIIACSEAIANSVQDRRTETIYAGLQVNAAPKSLMSHSGPLRIGVLTRLAPVKDIEAVIRAVSCLKDLKTDVEVDIAGTGPSRESLRQLTDALGIADRVHFLGWQEDTRELLSSWDLLLVTSLDEGFPISALEAMAAERPVIATRVGGLPELVIDKLTGILVPPSDLATLVRSIAQVANNREMLDKMGREGRKRVLCEFSAEKMANHIAQYYKSLLNRGELASK